MALMLVCSTSKIACDSINLYGYDEHHQASDMACERCFRIQWPGVTR